MLAGEVFRFLLDKMFYRVPETLDQELSRLERIAGGRTYSLHLTVQYNGRNGPNELWMSASFDVRSRGSIGLPTEQLRPRTPFQSPEEARRLWDWMLATKAARGIQGVYLDERFYPGAAELAGQALIENNLAEALGVLAAPLRSLRAITWHDDRGPGHGVNLHALIASHFPQADAPVNATIYGAVDTPEEIALIRSWGERTAAEHNVSFQFD